MITPKYNQWGRHVIAVALNSLAYKAAALDHRIDRKWRALQDTTNDPIIASRRPLPWRSWSRSEDYYVEGLLIWLKADTLIRDMSNNKRSLDDFARTFFGIDDGSSVLLVYDFHDIVTGLNTIQPYDWEIFLQDRIVLVLT